MMSVKEVDTKNPLQQDLKILGSISLFQEFADDVQHENDWTQKQQPEKRE